MSKPASFASSNVGLRDSSLAWIVCLSAGLFFLYEFFQLNLFDTINRDFSQALSLNSVQVGWISSSFLIADVLFLLPAGLILDRFSIRSVILFALVLSVAGTFGFAVTHSFTFAFFCHFLSGIGNAFCFLACVMLVTQWFPRNRQALVIGIIVTMAFLGGTLAHVPLLWLKAHFGWRQSLMIDGLVGIGILAIIALFVSEKRPNLPVKKTAHQPFWKSLRLAVQNRQNWVLGLYTAILNLPIMVLCALWGTRFMTEVYGWPEQLSSEMMSNIFYGSMVGCPVIGWLSDQLDQRRSLMIFCAIITLLLSLPMSFGWQVSPTTMKWLCFTIGFITSAQVLSYPLIAESNPLEYRGAATGFASVLIMGGGMVGQLLYSFMLNMHAQQQTVYTSADHLSTIIMLPILFVGAIVTAILIRTPTNNQPIKET
ncbi:MFS transporter [Legionella sp. W05-934-2]|uniref:MFS transporter n=1 Tax=Legionella sp. W05-934-2 TaxID=1198649 RepID=UPI00346348DB